MSGGGDTQRGVRVMAAYAHVCANVQKCAHGIGKRTDKEGKEMTKDSAMTAARGVKRPIILGEIGEYL
jgi:hypothetical protein